MNRRSLLFATLFTLITSISFPAQSVFFQNLTENASSEWIGGKASNLLLLEKIPGIKVPQWFCISSELFQQHLNDSDAASLIKKLDELCINYKENEEQILETGAEIQNVILKHPIRKDALEKIDTAYRQLGENLSIAVRSSGILEDLTDSSFAGLYDTCLNRRGLVELHKAVREVWASSFNARLIMERAKAGTDQNKCLMGVIVQEMVHAKAAGIACSMELSSSYPGIEICANYGIGESVVGGEVSTDKWLLHPAHNYVIKSTLGQKLFYSDLADGQGILHRETENSEQNRACLQFDELFQVADQTRSIRSHYPSEIDVEFAFDRDGILYILQARPLVQISENTLSIVDPEDARQHAVIASADYSVPGVVHGRLKFIDRWEDLANKTLSIEPDDIVVMYVAVNYWSHYLTQFKGLITKQGGPTTHPVLLCRERKVPCLIGIGDDFENLRPYSGKTITLDGIGRKVYDGAVKLKEASPSDLMKAFEPVKVREWKPFMDRIFELKKGGYIFEFDGRYWLSVPTYPVKKLFQEIHLKRSERLPILIQGHTGYRLESCVIDNHVCSTIEPAEEYMRCFRMMTLEECEQFCQNQEKNLQEHLNTVRNFKLDPLIWQQYVDTLSDLRAYGWVAEIFRMYVDREAEILASSFDVPQYYFDECSSYIQSQLVEEDTLMQRDIYKLASKMKHRNVQEFADEIEKLAKHYRFSSKAAIETDLDLDIVYRRLAEEADQIENGKTFTATKRTDCNYSYFPQIPSLYRWLYLSIYNRVLQSNAHHYVMRFQWNVRSELLRLGSYWTSLGKLKTPADIFDLSSEEIKFLITTWREAGNE